MNKRLENYLWKRFADMLPDRKKLTPQNSCMYWGFAVGDGWYNLIKRTLEKAEMLCNEYPDSGVGFKIAQVKEKFGCLRIYFDGWLTPHGIEWREDPMQKLFLQAEAESANICEMCGRPGVKERRDGWIKSLCDRHDRFQQKRGNKQVVKQRKELGRSHG